MVVLLLHQLATFTQKVSYLSHISPITFFMSILLNVKKVFIDPVDVGGFVVEAFDNINEALSDSIYIISIFYSLTPTTENVNTELPIATPCNAPAAVQISKVKVVFSLSGFLNVPIIPPG